MSQSCTRDPDVASGSRSTLRSESPLQASDSLDRGESRSNTTSRLISQLLPAQPSQHASSSQHRGSDGPSLSRLPLRATPRLSHPLPPPPSPSLLYSPVAKRPRFSDPLVPENGLLSTARPLSQMVKPSVAPAALSPARSLMSTQTTPLKLLHQPSIQEFQDLLPPTVLAPSPSRSTRQRLRYDMIHDDLNTHHVNPQEEQAPVFKPVPWKHKHQVTGFASIDRDFEKIARSTMLDPQDHEASLHDTSSSLHTSFGLPSGSLLEVTGPPGSGKSRFCVQMAVTERLRSLLQARSSLAEKRTQGENEILSQEDEASHEADSMLFAAEEFWDAEMASADQTLLIDCEGALQAECINDAVWSIVLTLWEKHDPRSSTDLPQNRADTPEVVRALVAAVLSGINICRVTTSTELVALLSSLRTSDDVDHLPKQSANVSVLLSRPSLIIIDSLSHHLRIPGSSAKERKQAAYTNELVQNLLLRLQQPFQKRVNTESVMQEEQDTPETFSMCAPTVVFTNQLGVRRAKSEGPGPHLPFRAGPKTGGKDYMEGGSLLVPQLQGQRLASQARSQERPAPSLALSGPEIWDDDNPVATSLRGPRTDVHLGHDRGWAPSFLGSEVWRILLFRHVSSGRRSAQVVSIPTSTQVMLNAMWEQTKRRGAEPEFDVRTSDTETANLPPPGIRGLIQTLQHIRESLFKWRPLLIDSYGLIEEPL